MIYLLIAIIYVVIYIVAYRIGFEEGKLYESEKYQIRSREFQQILKDHKPNTHSYSWNKQDGYEIFHINVN